VRPKRITIDAVQLFQLVQLVVIINIIQFGIEWWEEVAVTKVAAVVVELAVDAPTVVVSDAVDTVEVIIRHIRRIRRQPRRHGPCQWSSRAAFNIMPGIPVPVSIVVGQRRS